MQIIEAVCKAERPMSPADLACQLNIPKPSIHRLLNQLEGDGFVQTNMRGLIIPSAKMHSIAWACCTASVLALYAGLYCNN